MQSLNTPNSRSHDAAHRHLLSAMRADSSPIESRMLAIYSILEQWLDITTANRSDPEYVDIILTLRSLINNTIIAGYISTHIDKDEKYIHPVVRAIYQEIISEASSQIATVQKNVSGTLGTPTN